MRTIFLGTGWESLEALKVLHDDPFFDVVCVITAPDKPVGRKQKLTPSEVKKYALENNIPVVHTEKKKENYIKVLEEYKPEIVVCKAFGEIIPKEFLDYPKYGCINIHFSILPKYRGAVPIQKAILEGEKETGITIMLMSEGLDEGDILKIFKEEIKDDDTNITLRERLVKKTTEVLIPTLKNWIDGNITPVEQKDEDATYCWQKDISKESAEIIWNQYEPEYIERMVRALVPWPVAWTQWDNKRVMLFDVDVVRCEGNRKVGEFFVKGNSLLFGTRDTYKCIKVNELQLAGKKKIDAKTFINGFRSKF